jgi:hypothetical protein
MLFSSFFFFSRWLYGGLCLKGVLFIPFAFFSLFFFFGFVGFKPWLMGLIFVFCGMVMVFSKLQSLKPALFLFLFSNKLFTREIEGSLLGILLFAEYQKKHLD